jgi:hypothetical protein
VEENEMRSMRFSIAALMGVVLVAAIGLAALRSSSETWAGVLFLTTLAALGIALVGACCRTGAERGGWIGFAVLGWIYMGAAFAPYILSPKLPTQSLLELLAPRIGGISGPLPAFRPSTMGGGSMGGASFGGFAGNGGGPRAETFFQIGHCFLTLLAASLGALLGSRLFGAALEKSERISAVEPAAQGGGARRWWVVPLVFVMTGLVVVAAIAGAGVVFSPGVWAGSTFLLTWCLIGLVALGALIGRAKPREAWLGATLLGAGFMVLAFGHLSYERSPGPPTVELLNEIRPSLPSFANGRRADAKSVTAANARIHDFLAQPVPMHFKDETPLEDVLKFIQNPRADAGGNAIPIYVDPIGLQEADKTMWSTVRGIDLDGVSLRTSLRLCLRQLDLTYSVKDGLLLITSLESEDQSLPLAPEDAFQVVAHCVLALLAVGLGGLAAPLVCGLARKPAG